MSRNEKRRVQNDRRKYVQQGSGIYIFKNITRGDLTLPRPTKSGMRTVPVNGTFQGDSYYLFMLKNDGGLSLVKVVQPADVEQPVNESVDHMDNRLITEQPPVVTTDGKVEYVQVQPGKMDLNEEKNKPVMGEPLLLNENPLDGVEII